MHSADHKSLPVAATSESVFDASSAGRSAVRTDFQSLTSRLPKQRQPTARSFLDRLIAFLIPLHILLMVYAVVFFLLDVRFVYTEVHDANLRFVALVFILGVVGLSRLMAGYAPHEYAPYAFGLAFAIGLYTFVTTGAYGVGAFTRNFMNSNPFLATAFNMSIVGLLWWAVHRLMYECCLAPVRATTAKGLWTALQAVLTERITEAKPVRKRTVEHTEDVWYELTPVDPTERPVVEASPGLHGKASHPGRIRSLREAYPGVSVMLFAVPALVVFALGLRIVQHGGKTFVLAAHFYTAVYVFATLSLLMLTHLHTMREYYRERHMPMPDRVGYLQLFLGYALVVIVMVSALQMPLPSLPPLAYVDTHQTDFWTRTSSFTLQHVTAAPVEVLAQAHWLRTLECGVQWALAAFSVYLLLYGLYRALSWLIQRYPTLPRPLRALCSFVARVITGVLGWSRKGIRSGTVPRRRRISASVARSASFRNSLGDPDRAAKLSLREHIEYAYAALCALAEDIGMPKAPSETAQEFLQRLPHEAFGSLREEIETLTRLYYVAAYSPLPMDPRTMDALRRFWMQYERVRARWVR